MFCVIGKLDFIRQPLSALGHFCFKLRLLGLCLFQHGVEVLLTDTPCNHIFIKPHYHFVQNLIFLECAKLKTVVVSPIFEINCGQFKTRKGNGLPCVELYSAGTYTESKINITERAANDLFTGNIYYFGALNRCQRWTKDGGEIVHSDAAHNYAHGACVICGAKDDKGVAYKYESGAYYVGGYTGDGEIVEIAETWDDGTHGEHAVTYVAKKAFENKTTIKRVIMPSITDLGGQVFWGCENLEYVDMRSVTYIKYNQPGRPDGATESNNNFRFCNSLATVIVGNGYSSETGQFNSDHTNGIVDLYVYGTSTVTTHADDKILSGNVYYYSDTEKAGAWHFANGAATLW